MKRIASLTIALVAMLFLSGCVGSEKLPEDFEGYESEYGFSIDLPKGWVVQERRMPSPGEFLLECYPSEHSKNPDIEFHVWNSSIEDVDDFLKNFYDGHLPKGIGDFRIADRTGKRVVSSDDRYEYIMFYFPTNHERYRFDIRYYYGMLTFRRGLSSFDDAEWNRFVDRIAGSLELED